MIPIQDNEGRFCEIDRIPDECPICHHGIHVKPIITLSWHNEGLEILYKCPRGKCGNAFLGRYRKAFRGNGYDLSGVAPRLARVMEHPAKVKEVSPDFIEIYKEANEAETRNLLRIAGVGYRKALEFLIKDYCIEKKAKDADRIKKTNLSNVIDNYVDNEKIKQCAKRAVWVGNDETHYERLHKDSDIEDLKLLIKLTSNWIDDEFTTEKLIAKIESAKNKK